MSVLAVLRTQLGGGGGSDACSTSPGDLTARPDLRLCLERVTRIELALSAWEADVLPLNYTRERPPEYLAAAGARQ